MIDFIVVLLVGLVLGIVAAIGWKKLFRKGGGARSTQVLSSIDQLKSIGQLSVYKVLTKEIVTETDHTWGEFGNRYLGWVLSKKKMAMIFEFEIDFRYDLQRPELQINKTGESTYAVKMPPCEYEVHIRDIRFYDEQGSKLLPWLLPDLLNGFLSDGFSEEDKNRLVNAARAHAEKQAIGLIESMQSEVQKSARTTLESISHAFGATSLAFSFLTEQAKDLDVELDVELSGMAS